MKWGAINLQIYIFANYVSDSGLDPKQLDNQKTNNPIKMGKEFIPMANKVTKST